MIREENFPHDGLYLGLLIANKKAAQAARFFVFYLCASNALKGPFEIAISFAAF